MANNSKDKGEHHDHDHNEGFSDGGCSIGQGYYGGVRGRGCGGGKSEFPHGTCYTCGSLDHYKSECPSENYFFFLSEEPKLLIMPRLV